MEKIRIGIIGAGQIGKSHLERYSKIPGAEVVAVCDIDEETAKLAAEKYEIPDRYTDFRKMLERDDIYAVDVCLHNNFHSTISIAAMESGKHVYCEKPIAGTYIDGLKMVESAKETSRMLHIQLGTLYSKGTKAAKSLIEEGKLGQIYHGRSTGYRRRNRPFIDGYGTAAFTSKEIAGGGALLDMGVYHIAQMLYLMGMPKVERVRGKIYQELKADPVRSEQSGFDVEELATGFVTFAEGVTMDIIESWAVHMGNFEGSSLMGSQGGIRLPGSDPNSKFTYYTTIGDIDMDCYTDLNALDHRWHLTHENEEAYDSSQHHWIAALQGRVELLPTAELALQVMNISEGIYLSDRLGREVSIDEITEHSQSKAIRI